MTQMQALKKRIAQITKFVSGNIHHIAFLPQALFKFKTDIVTLRGRVRGADEATTVLYVGRGLNFEYLKKNVFTDVEIVTARKANLLTYRRKMKDLEASADVSFIDIGWPYHAITNKRGDYLEMPDWLTMYIPLEGSFEDVEKGFRKTTRRNDMRLIRRNNYTYESDLDEAFNKRFYDDFYLPFINHRHAGEVMVTSRRMVEKRARQGNLLRVIGDDGPIAAGLVYPDDGVLNFLWTGMPARYLENPPEAAVSALNHFCLKFAHENGYEFVNLMGTRSFPTDGVFQFKRRWGAIVEDTFSPSSVLFKPAAGNQKAAEFCARYPSLARRNGKLEQVLCATGPQFAEAECNALVSSYDCEGVDLITVVRVTDQTAEPLPDVSAKYPNVRVIRRDLEHFAQAYTRDFKQD